MNMQTQTRRAEVKRQTTETDISIVINLDGDGASNVKTGIGFLDHMLTLFARHGLFDVDVECRGDLHIDDHHTAEDVAICLGQAVREALGNKEGIARYGEACVPMDEALCRAVVDLSGRFFLVYEASALKETGREKVGDLSCEMAEHFWYSFAEAARMNLHLDVIRGRNAHHILEAQFKSVARALRRAVEFDARVKGVMSTKGSL